MHFHCRHNLSLLRVLTPVLGSAVTPDTSCLVGFELFRVAALQAYLANAGLLTPQLLWLYSARSRSRLLSSYVSSLTILARGLSAPTSFREPPNLRGWGKVKGLHREDEALKEIVAEPQPSA
jgi:hypothetical protein